MKDQLLQDLIAEFGDTLSESEIMEIISEATATDDEVNRVKELDAQFQKTNEEYEKMNKKIKYTNGAAIGAAAVGLGALAYKKYKAKKAAKKAEETAGEQEYLSDSMEFVLDQLNDGKELSECTVLLTEDAQGGYTVESDVIEFLMEAAEMTEDEVLEFLAEAEESLWSKTRSTVSGAVEGANKKLGDLKASTSRKVGDTVEGAKTKYDGLSDGQKTAAKAGVAGAAVGLGALAYKKYKAKKAAKRAEETAGEQEYLSDSMEFVLDQLNDGKELSECTVLLTEDAQGGYTVESDVVEFLMEATGMDNGEVLEFLAEARNQHRPKRKPADQLQTGYSGAKGPVSKRQESNAKIAELRNANKKDDEPTTTALSVPEGSKPKTYELATIDGQGVTSNGATETYSSDYGHKNIDTRPAETEPAKTEPAKTEPKKGMSKGMKVGIGAAAVGLGALAYKKYKAKKAAKKAEDQEYLSDSMEFVLDQLNDGKELSECTVLLTENARGNLDVEADVVEFLMESTGMSLDEVLEFLAEEVIDVYEYDEIDKDGNKTHVTTDKNKFAPSTDVKQTTNYPPAPVNAPTTNVKSGGQQQQQLSGGQQQQQLSGGQQQQSGGQQQQSGGTSDNNKKKLSTGAAIGIGAAGAAGVAGVAGAAVGLGALIAKKRKAKKAAQLAAQKDQAVSEGLDFLLDQMEDGMELSECTLLLTEGAYGNLNVEADVVEFLMEAAEMTEDEVLDFLMEAEEVKQVLPGNGIVEITSEKTMAKIQNRQSADLGEVKGKQATYTLPGNGIQDTTSDKAMAKVQNKQCSDLCESTEYDVYAESFYGDHLINEAILTDTHVNLTEDEMTNLIAGNLLSEKSIVRLDKEARRSQAEQKALVVIAREQNDPLYHKLTKVYKQKRTILDALDKKYGTRAVSRVRTNAKRINKDK